MSTYTTVQLSASALYHATSSLTRTFLEDLSLLVPGKLFRLSLSVPKTEPKLTSGRWKMCASGILLEMLGHQAKLPARFHFHPCWSTDLRDSTSIAAALFRTTMESKTTSGRPSFALQSLVCPAARYSTSESLGGEVCRRADRAAVRQCFEFLCPR